jgi:hypothetical protein
MTGRSKSILVRIIAPYRSHLLIAKRRKYGTTGTVIAKVVISR